MEYGINSIEDNANKPILAALEDLDNTFFNKHLYSKDEEESKYGIEEHIYGNTDRAPKNMNHIEVNYNIAYDVLAFLKNYSDVYDIPSPE
ncbi:hypothetical protein C1645_820239 [Glomus cerebriforme]|uniref:Uncharacterized protein n=1 Tax=Glomus cerebriforme TaxID=658196 RepID=A0A397T8Q0_9GLOM|nr:hypothetical protein C1645_820239 [Glomus cerebriforme]